MDYRFSHNYEDGVEHRIDAADDEEAIRKAEDIMAEAKSKKSPEQQYDMRARLTKAIQLW
jgi:hypothetical protein